MLEIFLTGFVTKTLEIKPERKVFNRAKHLVYFKHFLASKTDLDVIPLPSPLCKYTHMSAQFLTFQSNQIM